MAFAGSVSDQFVATFATVASNAWSTYVRFNPDRDSVQNLDSILMHFEDAHIATHIIAGRFLLCLVADQEVKAGLLQIKTRSLAEHFESQFAALV